MLGSQEFPCVMDAAGFKQSILLFVVRVPGHSGMWVSANELLLSWLCRCSGNFGRAILDEAGVHVWAHAPLLLMGLAVRVEEAAAVVLPRRVRVAVGLIADQFCSEHVNVEILPSQIQARQPHAVIRRPTVTITDPDM